MELCYLCDEALGNPELDPPVYDDDLQAKLHQECHTRFLEIVEELKILADDPIEREPDDI